MKDIFFISHLKMQGNLILHIFVLISLAIMLKLTLKSHITRQSHQIAESES